MCQGNEGLLTLQGKGRVLSVEAGMPHRSLELMPHRFLPVEAGSHSSLKVPTDPSALTAEPGLNLLLNAKSRATRLRAAQWGSLSVEHDHLRTMLVELYCPTHDLRRIWGHQILSAAIWAKKAEGPQRLYLRVFSPHWPLSTDPRGWPFWDYSGRPRNVPWPSGVR